MAKTAIQTLAAPHGRSLELARNVALVVVASLFVALCAHITIPLMPLTPVPLTVQNLGVLLVGLLLGSRRGFAALALYLIEGAAGLPVFNPTGPGGVAQLFGVTGGFLLVYPLVEQRLPRTRATEAVLRIVHRDDPGIFRGVLARATAAGFAVIGIHSRQDDDLASRHTIEVTLELQGASSPSLLAGQIQALPGIVEVHASEAGDSGN